VHDIFRSANRSCASLTSHSNMATESKAFTVVAVPCLEDNYAYLVVCLAAGAAAVVDAVNPDRVVEAINNTKAKSPGIHLKYILTTHKHGFPFFLHFIMLQYISPLIDKCVVLI